MQADFYILKNNSNRELFACKLVEKGYALNKRVHIHTDSQPQAERFDELIWTFRDGSFIPHDILGNPVNSQQQTKITIGYQDQSDVKGDILMNFSPQIPTFIERFPRIIEIISDDESIKQVGRQHFSHYKNLGYQLNHYNI